MKKQREVKVEIENQCAPIAELTPHSQSVCILFSVLELGEPRNVFLKKTGNMHRVANARIGDSTAVITLTLWDFDIDELREGGTYILKNGYVSVFEGSMRLNRSRYGEIIPHETPIESINQRLDMSRPFIGERKKTRRRTISEKGRSFHGTPKREKKGYCSWRSF